MKLLLKFVPSFKMPKKSEENILKDFGFCLIVIP